MSAPLARRRRGGEETSPATSRPTDTDALPAVSVDVATQLAAIVEQGTPDATRRALERDVAYFERWAELVLPDSAPWPVPVGVVLTFLAHHLEAMPEDLEAELVAAGARRPGRRTVSTIARYVASLSTAHRLSGFPHEDNPTRHPQVREVLSRARRRERRNGHEPRRAQAATRDVVERLVATCSTEDLADVRDRALLLLGFAAGGRRRSELAGLEVAHLEPMADGYLWHLGQTKTGNEQELPILGRAARALAAWLDASGIREGAVFRAVRGEEVASRAMAPRTVARIVARRARQAGLEGRAWSGHSLRRGYVTEAGRQGIPRGDAKQMSGHRSDRVFDGYYQAGELAQSPAARLAE